jgi:hypothetical protein
MPDRVHEKYQQRRRPEHVSQLGCSDLEEKVNNHVLPSQTLASTPREVILLQ